MRAVLAILVFLLGTVLIWIAVMTVYVLFTVLADYHDFEGATGMGVAFVLAPAIALVSALVVTVWFLRRGRMQA